MKSLVESTREVNIFSPHQVIQAANDRAYDASYHCVETRSDLATAEGLDRQGDAEMAVIHRLAVELVARVRELGIGGRIADIASALPQRAARVISLDAAEELYWSAEAGGAVDRTQEDVIAIIQATEAPHHRRPVAA